MAGYFPGYTHRDNSKILSRGYIGQYPPSGGGGILVKTPIKRILLRPSVHIEPQFLRIQMVFPNTSLPDAQYSIIVINLIMSL